MFFSNSFFQLYHCIHNSNNFQLYHCIHNFNTSSNTSNFNFNFTKILSKPNKTICLFLCLLLSMFTNVFLFSFSPIILNSIILTVLNIIPFFMFLCCFFLFIHLLIYSLFHIPLFFLCNRITYKFTYNNIEKYVSFNSFTS